jgi:hypothetical protein
LFHPLRDSISVLSCKEGMTDERLPTELWLKAHMRRLNIEGIPVAVIHRGEAMGGTVLLKLNQLELGCRVLTQARGFDGALGWLAAFQNQLVAEPEADAYIARAVKRDPDLWVLEIEDRAGRHLFEGKLL